MSKYRFVEGEPPEGTPTLGVVYHVARQKAIRVCFEECGLTSPIVLGYVVVDEERTRYGQEYAITDPNSEQSAVPEEKAEEHHPACECWVCHDARKGAKSCEN